jgi:hypothetical protein
VRQRAATVQDGELVGDVVKPGSEVVDAFSDADAEIGGRVLDVLDSDDGPPFVIVRGKGLVDLALKKVVQGVFDCVQVFFGPIELQEDAV